MQAEKRLRELTDAVRHSRKAWNGNPQITKRIKHQVYMKLIPYVDEVGGFNRATAGIYRWCQGKMNQRLSELWLRRLRIGHRNWRKERNLSAIEKAKAETANRI